MDEPGLDRKQLLSLAILFEGGLGALALLLGWLFNVPILGAINLDFESLAVGVGVSVPMLVLFAACVRWPIGPLRSIRDFTDQVIRPLFRSCTLLDLALICILAGFGEEALFRGFLQPLLERWFEPWLAIGITSVAFGLMHPISQTYVVLATGVGIYLGVVYLLNDNLLVVMFAHGLYDFIALVYVSRLRTPPLTLSAERET